MALDPIAQTTCPVPLALQATRGDSLSIQIRLLNAATGRPIVLTGWSGVVNIMPSPIGGQVLHTLTVTVDQSAANMPTTGIVTITAGINETVGFIEQGYWALVLTDGTTSKTIIAGPWLMAGNSVGSPSFVCGSGAGVSGFCGSLGFALIGTDCGVLAAGYQEISLPHPQSTCSCA